MTDLTAFEKTSPLLDQLMNSASTEDLQECIRLLGLNLAHYRRKFGEIPAGELNHLLTTNTIDEELAQLLTEGMQQSLSTLKQVTQTPNSDNSDLH